LNNLLIFFHLEYSEKSLSLQLIIISLHSRYLQWLLKIVEFFWGCIDCTISAKNDVYCEHNNFYTFIVCVWIPRSLLTLTAQN